MSAQDTLDHLHFVLVGAHFAGSLAASVCTSVNAVLQTRDSGPASVRKNAVLGYLYSFFMVAFVGYTCGNLIRGQLPDAIIGDLYLYQLHLAAFVAIGYCPGDVLYKVLKHPYVLPAVQTVAWLDVLRGVMGNYRSAAAQAPGAILLPLFTGLVHLCAPLYIRGASHSDHVDNALQAAAYVVPLWANEQFGDAKNAELVLKAVLYGQVTCVLLPHINGMSISDVVEQVTDVFSVIPAPTGFGSAPPKASRPTTRSSSRGRSPAPRTPRSGKK